VPKMDPNAINPETACGNQDNTARHTYSTDCHSDSGGDERGEKRRKRRGYQRISIACCKISLQRI
jgi:hypothetical protein